MGLRQEPTSGVNPTSSSVHAPSVRYDRISIDRTTIVRRTLLPAVSSY